MRKHTKQPVPREMLILVAVIGILTAMCFGIPSSRGAILEQGVNPTNYNVNLFSLNTVGEGYGSDFDNPTVPVQQTDATGFVHLEFPEGAITDSTIGPEGVWFELNGLGVSVNVNSFERMDTPNGTDPVASSPTDTLTWLDGTGITITGSSAADSITITNDLPLVVPGNDSEVIYNSAGSLAAEDQFTWNATTNVLTLAGDVTSIILDGVNETITTSSGTMSFGGDAIITTGTLTAGGTTYPTSPPAFDDFFLRADGDGSSEWVPASGIGTTLDIAYDSGHIINYTTDDEIEFNASTAHDPTEFLTMDMDADQEFAFLTNGNFYAGNGTTDYIKISSNGVTLVDDSGQLIILSATGAGGGSSFIMSDSNHTSTFSLNTETIGAIFNEIGDSSLDFRIESDNNINAFFIDAGADTIDIVGASLTIGDTDTQTSLVLADGSTNYIIVDVPPLASDWTWLYPINDGTAGQVLTTPGDGSTLTWETPTGADAKVGVDTGAVPDFLGAAFNDGALRVTLTEGLKYTDGGNFITLGLDADYADISGNDAATDITGAQLEELSDASTTSLHNHADQGTTDDYSGISANDGATDVSGAELETLSDGSNADSLHVHITDNVIIDSTPDSDDTAEGIKSSLTAGENVVFVNVGYQNADGEVYLADADGAGTYPAFCMFLETKSDGQAVSVITYGYVRDDTWTWTVGGIIYLSDTAGGLTQVAPSTTGDQVQIMGVATHADRMMFNPNLMLIEIN